MKFNINKIGYISFWSWSVFFSLFLLFSLGLLIYNSLAKNDKPLVSLKEDFGTINQIGTCNHSKYSYSCNFSTNKFKFTGFNVLRLPFEQIKINDKISKRVDIYDNFAKVYYIQNGYQVSTSSCFSFMPCFSKYENQI